jgi:hypothetical protein
VGGVAATAHLLKWWVQVAFMCKISQSCSPEPRIHTFSTHPPTHPPTHPLTHPHVRRITHPLTLPRTHTHLPTSRSDSAQSLHDRANRRALCCTPERAYLRTDECDVGSEFPCMSPACIARVIQRTQEHKRQPRPRRSDSTEKWPLTHAHSVPTTQL